MKYLYSPACLFSLLILGYSCNVIAQTVPATNPDLALRCPYNIILVLDESGSINGSGGNTQNIASQLRNGARDLINALVGTGSRLAVVEFNSNARRAVIGGSTAYQTIDAVYAAAFNTYTRRDNNQTPSSATYDPEDYSCQQSQCSTNWEAAFDLVLNIIATNGYAQLVIFFTDGVPTAYVNNAGNVITGSDAATMQLSLQESITPANAVKNGGTHIFVVGIPNPTLPEANVQAISGMDKYPLPEGDFSKGDYTVSTSQSLQNDLADIANHLTANFTRHVNICKGDSYFAGGALQTQAGTYYDTFLVTGGCDSIVTTMLAFYPLNHDTFAVTICNNETYFAGGAQQNTNGAYNDTFTAASNGCDSMVTTLLTVLTTRTSFFLRVPVCPGDSIFLSGHWLSHAGFYTDTFTAANGCDSIMTIVLVIPNCNDFDACTFDYCQNTLCQHSPLSCTANISGIIQTETGIPVPGVAVTLSGSDNQTFITAANGLYNFTVTLGGNYTVTPAKTNDVNITNGITTFDLNLVRQHVLGVNLLNSPYKIIAADANLSESVSTLDVSIIRSLLLGATAGYPTNRLWQFVPDDFVFADALHPFPFDEARNYTGISTDYTNQNFIGIKTCDVNNSWNPLIP